MDILHVNSIELAHILCFRCGFRRSLSDGKTGLTGTAENARNHSGLTLILRVKCSYFEMCIVVNRPYFVPQTIPYNVFKYSQRFLS